MAGEAGFAGVVADGGIAGVVALGGTGAVVGGTGAGRLTAGGAVGAVDCCASDRGAAASIAMAASPARRNFMGVLLIHPAMPDRPPKDQSARRVHPVS